MRTTLYVLYVEVKKTLNQGWIVRLLFIVRFIVFQTESPIFPSNASTSVSMQSPIQSSLSSPSQDHGYCSNTNGNNVNDRQVLEKNLERLISERGMEVIGQLTKEMSPQQIERLLIQTKQKLQATNSAPLTNGPNGEIFDDQGVVVGSVRTSRKALSNANGQSANRGSMNDMYHKQHSSSDEELEEDEADLTNANGMTAGNMKKGNMKQGHSRSKDSSIRLNGSAKNLSVRFDPSQVQTSPHMEHQQLQQHMQGGNGRRSHHHHGHGHHGHGHSRKGHHRSRRAMSRQPERANYHYHQAMIPRSHSYSGQVGLQESLAQMGNHQMPLLSRHQSPHVGRRPPMNGPHSNYYSNYHPHQGFIEDDDVCSTCSSSSSDSDDPYAYQLPPRKAYGGVRLSYVPNDRIRARNHQRSIQPNSEYVSQRHSLRGGSAQPQSLPAGGPPARPQMQTATVVPPQPQSATSRHHSDYHPMQPTHHPHHHAHHGPQQQPQYAHPGPASGSSVSSKDKDKCIIS